MASNYMKTVQQQLFQALVMQTLIPVILMYAPITILFLFPMLNINVGFISSFATATIAIYPAVDPLPTMFIIKSYRNALFWIINGFVYKNNSNKMDSLVSVITYIIILYASPFRKKKPIMSFDFINSLDYNGELSAAIAAEASKDTSFFADTFVLFVFCLFVIGSIISLAYCCRAVKNIEKKNQEWCEFHVEKELYQESSLYPDHWRQKDIIIMLNSGNECEERSFIVQDSYDYV